MSKLTRNFSFRYLNSCRIIFSNHFLGHCRWGLERLDLLRSWVYHIHLNPCRHILGSFHLISGHCSYTQWLIFSSPLCASIMIQSFIIARTKLQVFTGDVPQLVDFYQASFHGSVSHYQFPLLSKYCNSCFESVQQHWKDNGFEEFCFHRMWDFLVQDYVSEGDSTYSPAQFHTQIMVCLHSLL